MRYGAAWRSRSRCPTASRPGAVAFEVSVESPRPASCAVEDGALVVRDMLSAVAEATEILGSDKAYAEKLRRVAADVEPTHIGRWGQLQEWRQDIDDPNDHFGHTSHLYALYPSDQVTPETPAPAPWCGLRGAR